MSSSKLDPQGPKGLFESRKRDHLRMALDSQNQAQRLSLGDLTGFEDLVLRHEALPELNFDDVSIASTSLGQSVRTPFYVAGMTAGHADAPALNRVLARAAHRRGWAFGVGSQRRELERADSGSADHKEWALLRAETPGLRMIANLGIAQLIECAQADVDIVLQLRDALEAHAVAIHLNGLQEVLQPEGTPRFRGGLGAIERAVRALGNTPLVIKETGCGVSGATAQRLFSIGVRAIDVSGLGGTHWGRIEGARAAALSTPPSQPASVSSATGAPGVIQAQAAVTFKNWGLSTVMSLRDVLPHASGAQEVWASGGVRSGLDAAKALALGATQVGYAKPALEAALQGEEALDQWMTLQEFELRTALFCTGVASLDQLDQRHLL
jgi:isopentenyl-diphosphate delta-isomerase